jgi:azurin
MLEKTKRGALRPTLFFMIAAYLMTSLSAFSKTCTLNLHADDSLEFKEQSLTIPKNCEQVTIVLKHSGKLNKRHMGHGVMIAKSKDFKALSNQILANPSLVNHIPKSNRVIAASRIISGGETAAISFQLKDRANLIFFCHFPGHHSMSKRTFK